MISLRLCDSAVKYFEPQRHGEPEVTQSGYKFAQLGYKVAVDLTSFPFAL